MSTLQLVLWIVVAGIACGCIIAGLFIEEARKFRVWKRRHDWKLLEQQEHTQILPTIPPLSLRQKAVIAKRKSGELPDWVRNLRDNSGEEWYLFL